MAEKKQFEKALRGALVRWNEAERQRETTEEIPPMPTKFLAATPPVGRSVETKTRSSKEGFTMKQTRKWRKSAVAAMAAAALVAGSVCVYAAVPAVRAYINMLFLKEESVMRLTTVPEGYIGITTPEELEAVREKLDGNYILMNDIRIPDAWYEEGGIYEDGFAPIGGIPLWRENEGGVKYIANTNAFIGIFNGNGHVISNVHIQADGDDDYVGLFGLSEMEFQGKESSNDANAEPKGYSEVESKGGIIKNLGVVDSSIVVEEDGKNGTNSIGMIVGRGNFVVGCFTDNVTITYDHPMEYSYADILNPEEYTPENSEYVYKGIKIGGIAGEASIIDSCWSGADIMVTGATPARNRVFVAGVCGYTPTCVTSYFAGTIDSPVADWEVAYTLQSDPPVMLSEGALLDISIRLIESEHPELQLNKDKYDAYTLYSSMKEEYPDMEMLNYRMFNAFYTRVNYGFVQNYLTYSVEDNAVEYTWLLDPYLSNRERKRLSQIVSDAFTGEEFVKFCQENGVKYGAYDNYDLRREPDCDFEGFDFDYIWYREDGRNPVLRLFSYTWEEQGIVQNHEPDVPLDMVR